MAIIPLRQTITVARGGGGVDEWGQPLPGEVFTLPCRVDEGSQVVTSSQASLTEASTVVAEAKILLDKLADVRYTDEITYTNELGIDITRKPKQIDVKRGINGKPMFTEVFV